MKREPFQPELSMFALEQRLAARTAEIREERHTMNGKPVIEVPAKAVLNFESGFGHKLLCDSGPAGKPGEGTTFTTGSACAYSCSFCYVPDLMKKSPHMKGVDKRHDEVVIRRRGAVDAIRQQLTDRKGQPKYKTPDDRRVVYSSPLVDVAANMELVRETIEACNVILELTNWQIRLLSKSNLLPKVAQGIASTYHDRLIFGVSTGTLDDQLARVFEEGTPLVSKRLASLHWLQDHGFRTFGMLCPSLPQLESDYDRFARDMAAAIRADRCEHVWAEVLNVRGDSMTRTIAALRAGGFNVEARLLERTRNHEAWEGYARQTFLAHAPLYRPGQLRFLQYVNPKTREWWAGHQEAGAVLL